MSSDVATRDEIFGSLQENESQYIEEARERRMSMGVLIQGKCSDNEGKHHRWAADEFIARDGLRTQQTEYMHSSRVGDFKKPYQQALLMDYYDRLYQRSFHSVQVREAGQGLQSFTADTPFRPYDAPELQNNAYAMLAEGGVAMAEVPSSQFIQRGVMVDQINVKMPQILSPKDAILVRETPEGEDPPTINLGQEFKNVALDRFAITLNLGDAAMRTSDLFVAGLALDLIQVGVRYDELFSYKMGAYVFSNAPATSNVSINESKKDELMAFRTSFKDGNNADRIIGAKDEVMKYVSAVASHWNVDPLTLIGNRAQSQEMCFYFEEVEGVETTNSNWQDRIFALDSRNTLTRVEYVGGPEMPGSSFDSVKALHQRSFVRWMGFFEQNNAPMAQRTIVTA